MGAQSTSRRIIATAIALLLIIPPLSTPNAVANHPQPAFKFPWDNAASWYFTGGAHDYSAGSRSGLDFAYSGTNRTVLAAATGRITHQGRLSNDCKAGMVVKLDHGNGWETWYFHLASIYTNLAKVHSSIPRGFPIGVEGTTGGPSCNDRGALHAHIELRHNGAHYSWNNISIDGWVVRTGTNYNGSMQKGSRTVYPSAPAGANQLVQSSNLRSQDLGGHPDLGGYCRSVGHKDSRLTGGTAYDWKCVTQQDGLIGIDMTASCRYHYRRSDVFSVYRDYYDEYSWRCYTHSTAAAAQARTQSVPEPSPVPKGARRSGASDAPQPSPEPKDRQ